MTISIRQFNYIDVLFDLFKEVLDLKDDDLFIVGQMSEEDKKRMLKKEYCIIFQEKRKEPLVATPQRKIIRTTDNEETITTTRYTQMTKEYFDIIVLAYRNIKPDIARTVATTLQMSLQDSQFVGKKRLGHYINCFYVGELLNTDFVWGEEKDDVQRYQFTVGIIHDNKIEIDKGAPQVEVELGKVVAVKG